MQSSGHVSDPAEPPPDTALLGVSHCEYAGEVIACKQETG